MQNYLLKIKQYPCKSKVTHWIYKDTNNQFFYFFIIILKRYCLLNETLIKLGDRVVTIKLNKITYDLYAFPLKWIPY